MSGLKGLEPKVIFQAVLHVFCGFVAFVIVKAVSHLTRQHQDIRPFVLSACLAFFCAGFYCARSISKGGVRAAFLLALGGFLPAIAINRLGMAWTALPFPFPLSARQLVWYCNGFWGSFTSHQKKNGIRPGAGIDLSRCNVLRCLRSNPGVDGPPSLPNCRSRNRSV
jgi:hypothetical protein